MARGRRVLLFAANAAALENNLADLHHALGNEDDAMTHIKRAVTMFREVGPTTRPGYLRSGNW